MAEIKAQTTRGQALAEKPPEVVTIYGSDGTPHVCSPLDAREILAAKTGYTAEPSAPPTETASEQQSEQQSKPGDGAASGDTEKLVDAKPDDPGPANAGGETVASPSRKPRSRK